MRLIIYIICAIIDTVRQIREFERWFKPYSKSVGESIKRNKFYAKEIAKYQKKYSGLGWTVEMTNNAIEILNDTTQKFETMEKEKQIRKIEDKIEELQCEVEKLKCGVDFSGNEMHDLVWRKPDANNALWLCYKYDWVIERDTAGAQAIIAHPKC